jgi:hypothetical protein
MQKKKNGCWLSSIRCNFERDSSSKTARRLPQNDVLYPISKSSRLIFLILHFTFFIFHSSIAQAIEVSGHLTEDTTWNPANNPYEVVDHVFVDAGVTLT